MNSWRRSLASLALAVAGLAASGCGGSDADTRPRLAVTGEVTVDGKPLAAGGIIFDPKSRADGVGSQGPITDGKFSIGSKEGPTAGNYFVRIDSSGDPATEIVATKKLGDTKRDIDGPKIKNPIPHRFNANTILSAEVKASGPNDFKFELDSKPDPPSAKTAGRRKAR